MTFRLPRWWLRVPYCLRAPAGRGVARGGVSLEVRGGGNNFFGRFGVWSGNPNPIGSEGVEGGLGRKDLAVGALSAT